MDFISRLLEHEGIFYYFKHTQNTHTMGLSDKSSTLSSSPGHAIAHYSFSTSGWAEDQQDGITDLEWTPHAHRSGRAN